MITTDFTKLHVPESVNNETRNLVLSPPELVALAVRLRNTPYANYLMQPELDDIDKKISTLLEEWVDNG